MKKIFVILLCLSFGTQVFAMAKKPISLPASAVKLKPRGTVFTYKSYSYQGKEAARGNCEDLAAEKCQSGKAHRLTSWIDDSTETQLPPSGCRVIGGTNYYSPGSTAQVYSAQAKFECK